jgi:hypothetical protein
MARPRKTAAQLIKSGARAGRIAARVAEENIALGIKAVEKEKELGKRGYLLATFIAQVKKERESFFERLDPSRTVCREHGADFNWRDEHPLSVLKKYTDDVIAGSIVAGEFTKRACLRFQNDLRSGFERELFIDPIAVENIATWFTQFGEPGFDVQPWELFIVGQLVGWKLPSGLRRFREAWWEVGKKNGKTALMGGMGLFLAIADQEPNAEIYSLANTREQARLCFKAAQHWHDANRELREHVKAFKSSFGFGGSTYQILSSESKTADGPNVAAAFFDEVHEFANDELFEQITAGRAARKQPLWNVR